MTSGGRRILKYSSFNVPNCMASGTTSCVAGGNTLMFTFDSEHQRIKQVAPAGTTLYVNAGGGEECGRRNIAKCTGRSGRRNATKYPAPA